ncbi:MAG TPA: serine/threonine-protein kinase [Polyangiaceae bacterium]|nr:serine/threonine-protein kinase [Polyangiaceae bacterium]
MRTIPIGEVVDGRYVIERIAERSACGIVATARHVALNRLVALKFFWPTTPKDALFLQRVLTDVRAAAQLRSEHAARVLDAGTLGDGSVFVIYEHLPGRDLSAVLRKDGPLPLTVAVDYITQACEPLAEAQALGIGRRALQPSDLFLTRGLDGTPSIKVLDFGLGQCDKRPNVSRGDSGSRAMASPSEPSLQSLDSEGRSDVSALAMILFSLLTGSDPFAVTNTGEARLELPPDESLVVRSLRPELPPELDVLLARCLFSGPAERIHSISDFVYALRAFNPGQGAARAERIARLVSWAESAQEEPTLLDVSAVHANQDELEEPTRLRERPEPVNRSLAQVPSPSTLRPSSIPPSVGTTLYRARYRKRDRVATAAGASLLVGLVGTLWLAGKRTPETQSAASAVAAGVGNGLPQSSNEPVRGESSTVPGSAAISSSRAGASTALAVSHSSLVLPLAPSSAALRGVTRRPPVGRAPTVPASAANALKSTPEIPKSFGPAPNAPLDEDLILKLPH